MHSIVTYYNNRNGETTEIIQSIIPHSQVDFDIDTSQYYTLDPVTEKMVLLHSFNDEPCLIEVADRRHWMWYGVLHRTSGPAFETSSNQEWFVFGQPLDLEEFDQYKDYLFKVEAMALANDIAMYDISQSCIVDNDESMSKYKYCLCFRDEREIIHYAAHNSVPLKNLQTGEVSVVKLDELNDEINKEYNVGSTIALSIIGAATIAMINNLSNPKKELVTATDRRQINA
jgi:hypothetical protein